MGAGHSVLVCAFLLSGNDSAISGVPVSSSAGIMQSDSSEHMAAMRYGMGRPINAVVSGGEVAKMMWSIFQKKVMRDEWGNF